MTHLYAEGDERGFQMTRTRLDSIEPTRAASEESKLKGYTTEVNEHRCSLGTAAQTSWTIPDRTTPRSLASSVVLDESLDVIA